MEAQFCQSYCDYDADCHAYTAALDNCTVWGAWMDGSSAQMFGWTFREGDGATTVTRGQNTSHSRGMDGLFHVVDTDAEVFCMVKSTDLVTSSIEGDGIGFWVFHLVLPVCLVCCAIIVLWRGGRRKSEPPADEKEPLAHEKLPLEGADERTQKLFAMSQRPDEATGDA